MAIANILGFRAGTEKQKRGPRIKVDNPAAQKVLEAHRDFPIWKAAGAAMDSVNGVADPTPFEKGAPEYRIPFPEKGARFTQGTPEYRIPFPEDETTLPARPAADTYNADYDSGSLTARSPERKRGMEGLADFGGRIADAYRAASERGKLPVGSRPPWIQDEQTVDLANPEAPLPVSNQSQMSQVAQLPLEGGAEATRITRPDGSTRWATKNGYMDAATPKATSTNNALGITDEAFSPGGSFNVASGPRGGMSQAEWDGLSQEEATAIRVAGLEKQGQDLRDLRDVRSGRTGEELERAPNREPLIVGTSFADDFAFADRAGGGSGIGKLEDALEDKNPKTRREAINALSGIYKEQARAQPQTVGPDFGDQLAQAQMQQNAAFKQADLAGKQQDRMLNREQQALENRRAGTKADQAEVGVLTAQLDKVMGSGQVVPGTEGILNEVMLQKRASPLMVNSVIQEALVSLPKAREALNNSDTDPDALKDKQAALAAIRQYVAQKMP